MKEQKRQPYQLTRVGLAWDVNDPEPPRCLSEKQQRAKRSAKWIARLREKLKT